MGAHSLSIVQSSNQFVNVMSRSLDFIVIQASERLRFHWFDKWSVINFESVDWVGFIIGKFSENSGAIARETSRESVALVSANPAPSRAYHLSLEEKFISRLEPPLIPFEKFLSCTLPEKEKRENSNFVHLSRHSWRVLIYRPRSEEISR